MEQIERISREKIKRSIESDFSGEIWSHNFLQLDMKKVISYIETNFSSVFDTQENLDLVIFSISIDSANYYGYQKLNEETAINKKRELEAKDVYKKFNKLSLEAKEIEKHLIEETKKEELRERWRADIRKFEDLYIEALKSIDFKLNTLENHRALLFDEKIRSTLIDEELLKEVLKNKGYINYSEAPEEFIKRMAEECK